MGANRAQKYQQKYSNSHYHFNGGSTKLKKKKKKKKKKKGLIQKILKYTIYKPFNIVKNIFYHYLLHIIVIISILVTVCYYLFNKKEQFFNFFNKNLDDFPDRKVNYVNDTGVRNLRKENTITKNNRIQDTTYTPTINNMSKLPPTKKGPMRISSENEDMLEKVRTPEQSLKPVGQSLFGTLQCKVLSECPDGYYSTGAEFNGVKCQNDDKSKVAKAVASIKNGYISSIYLIDKGSGYTETPKIKIIGGGGSDAYATCMVQKNKLNKIELQNRGRNYNSTPKIVIEAPKTNHKCKLCCKK